MGALGLLVPATLAAASPSRSLARHAAVAGVPLGSTAFADARRRFGPAPLVHNGGDAAASKRHVCYRGPDGTTLVLAGWEGCGDDARGADEYQLVRRIGLAQFGASRYEVPKGFDPRCAPTQRISAATPVGGIRLGMTRTEVLARLGRPAADRTSELEYVDGRFHLVLGFQRGSLVAVRGSYWWE